LDVLIEAGSQIEAGSLLQTKDLRDQGLHTDGKVCYDCSVTINENAEKMQKFGTVTIDTGID